MARPRKEQELDIAGRAIDETIRLLAERGDLDVPLTAVATAVGCTAPALYGHFRSKSALLRAVREEGFDRLYKEKLALFEKMRGDPFGYLRDGSYAYVRFAVDNPALYRLIVDQPKAARFCPPAFQVFAFKEGLQQLSGSGVLGAEAILGGAVDHKRLV